MNDQATNSTFQDAMDRLSNDGFIAYPTETVWGLGASVDRPNAVARLCTWKGRVSDQPMSVLVSSATAASRMECVLEGGTGRLADAFWPGPLTIIVRCRRSFAPGIARADGALGLRCSRHPISRALALALDDAGLGPITSTSLNRTGSRPALERKAAQAMATDGAAEKDELSSPLVCGALADGTVFDAGASSPSTVVDCTSSELKILREGAIETSLLEEVWAR